MEKQSSENYQNGEGEVSVDMTTLQAFSNLHQSQSKKLYSESLQRRQIQKIPPQIRRRMRQSEQVYDPVMVSLGPYHHGNPGLQRAEEFKHLCLDRCAGGDEKKKAFFYSKILEQVSDIRDCYAEVTIVEKYNDQSLAMMMLLDASIIVDFIHNHNCQGTQGNSNSLLDWQRWLGAGSAPLMARDLMVMENQIPFQVLKLLICLRYEEGEEAALFLPRFLTWFLTLKAGIQVENTEIPEENEDPPIHFLEALRRVLVKEKRRITDVETKFISNKSYMHRSVMDLKAKGVRVRANPELSLREIKFVPGAFSCQLQLPVQYLSDHTPVAAANMIAFEVLPNHDSTSLVMQSYIIFLKSLIQSPEDVKELQENGIILNRLANHEKVVEMFKEIDTLGLHDEDIFKDVKMRIEEHCRSKARTWIAELIYTRFRTPWTAIALFAAALLLCLTFLQTFFTIRPVNQRPQ